MQRAEANSSCGKMGGNSYTTKNDGKIEDYQLFSEE